MRAKSPWMGLFAILAATLMNLLDSTIVNVAAPAIHAELGGSYTALQWIAAGYTLALAVGLLTGGRLGDMFGRKRMLMIGLVGFVAASLVCAVTPTIETLIIARVIQGLFGAVMIPQGFGLIRDLFPPDQMGKAFGIFGPMIGLATILGPVVAGMLVDADVFGTGWRMIFAINLPLGAFALLAGRIALPDAAPGQTTGRRGTLDLPGVVLAGVAMFALIFPLVQGRELGWPTWSLALLVASVPLIGGFIVYQIRRRRSGATPLVELSVFAKRSYTSGVAFVVVFFGAIVGFSLAVGLFLQLGLGYSPTRASMTMAAWAVGAFLGSGFSAGAAAKLGRRILHLGLAIMTVGTAGVYVVFERYGAEIGTWTLTAPLFIFGLGMGMIFVPLFDIIMGDIEDREVGSAAGMLESIQQLGASIGVAVLGTVFFGIAKPSTGSAGHGLLDAGTAVDAATAVTLLTIVLSVAAFGLGFLLPRKARAVHAEKAPEPELALVA
ncbi:MFS transporter [Phytohabitans aurantiacus]|jgi:EmrB/QacA subfamily drug resistance transporter|nr:MFS transporter [Phytohabitans aurantiacus]